jgi:hypothetical protein
MHSFKDSDEYYFYRMLPPGVHRYYFTVDGKVELDPSKPSTEEDYN